jgi:hypothetical protein
MKQNRTEAIEVREAVEVITHTSSRIMISSRWDQKFDGRIVSLYSDRISGHSRFTVVDWDDESLSVLP